MDIPYVRPENSLLVNVKKDKIINLLVTKLNALPNIKNLKDDLEVLKFACMIIENKVAGKPYEDKINKKEVVFLAYEKVFGASVINRATQEAQIDFLYNNEQITIIYWAYRIWSYIKSFFLKKFQV